MRRAITHGLSRLKSQHTTVKKTLCFQRVIPHLRNICGFYYQSQSNEAIFPLIFAHTYCTHPRALLRALCPSQLARRRYVHDQSEKRPGRGSAFSKFSSRRTCLRRQCDRFACTHLQGMLKPAERVKTSTHPENICSISVG